VTKHEGDAGPGNQPGPAREQVVIKDNRKIDSSGRPKTADDKTDGKPPTPPPGGMGQPGTPVAEAQAQVAQAQAAQAQAQAKAKAGAGTAEKAGTDAPPEVSTPEGRAKAADGDQAAAPAVPPALGAELESLRSELDERLADLQRVSAEYANYRKRVERDRGVVVEQAVGAVLAALLPILDDVDRAREHGDLNGPFAAVAEQLSTALTKFGLNVFGEKGDPFDPTRHEAVTHETSSEVTEPTCVSVMRRGYLLGDRLLRPAMVAVADPE
jgi:molecular chaperone GrpE